MKKFVRICLFLILLLPISFLSACGQVKYFIITANPSDSLLGSIDGIQDGALSEGSKVTLVAKEKRAETNPFICWVYNDNKIVSQEKSYTVTYKDSTQGNYTAVFSELNPQQMMYASITNISADLPDDIESLNVTLKSARNESGTTNYTNILSGSIQKDTPIETDKTNVVCFRDENGTYTYSFQMEIIINYSDGSQLTPYNFTFTNSINKELFENNLTYTLTAKDNTSKAEISVTFEKLSTSLFEK